MTTELQIIAVIGVVIVALLIDAWLYPNKPEEGEEE